MGKIKRTVKVLRKDKTYIIKNDGLWGKEREILDAMFSEDRKTVIKFTKLSSLQKKVLRKMNFDKRAFLVSN